MTIVRQSGVRGVGDTKLVDASFRGCDSGDGNIHIGFVVGGLRNPTKGCQNGGLIQRRGEFQRTDVDDGCQ